MAERRMFAKSIIDTDAFLEMPLSAQALYFHLSMRADDEGFVAKPKSIQRTIRASDDDFKILVAKRYILAFDTGVIVIKHWKIHNYIRGDRLQETNYMDEKSRLVLQDNNAYTEFNGDKSVPISTESVVNTECQSLVSQMSVTCPSNVSIGKDSIGKDNIGKDIYVEIIQYLNEKTHKSYKWQTKSTQRMINGRIEDGFSIDDFKTVIDKKCAEWLGDKEMDQYLRPETLFAAKHFESYLNQKMPGQKQDVMAMAAGLEKEMEAKYGRKDT